MRHWLRSHLTYANVMVTILAFAVLGGGTAFGALIITSNSQVAQNTISGHHPPSGKHPNIISASVSGQDVRDLPFTNLTLGPGWSGGCFGTGAPAVAKSVEGVVYLRGGLCRTSGSSNFLFTLPPGFRPSQNEYLTVDQYNGATGRIGIAPNGNVGVATDPQRADAAAGFTSLAGVSFTLPY
jgi:hypothetical protein